MLLSLWRTSCSDFLRLICCRVGMSESAASGLSCDHATSEAAGLEATPATSWIVCRRFLPNACSRLLSRRITKRVFDDHAARRLLAAFAIHVGVRIFCAPPLFIQAPVCHTAVFACEGGYNLPLIAVNVSSSDFDIHVFCVTSSTQCQNTFGPHVALAATCVYVACTHEPTDSRASCCSMQKYRNDDTHAWGNAQYHFSAYSFVQYTHTCVSPRSVDACTCAYGALLERQNLKRTFARPRLVGV